MNAKHRNVTHHLLYFTYCLCIIHRCTINVRKKKRKEKEKVQSLDQQCLFTSLSPRHPGIGVGKLFKVLVKYLRVLRSREISQGHLEKTTQGEL